MTFFKSLVSNGILYQHRAPDWLKFDPAAISATVLTLPSAEDAETVCDAGFDGFEPIFTTFEDARFIAVQKMTEIGGLVLNGVINSRYSPYNTLGAVRRMSYNKHLFCGKASRSNCMPITMQDFFGTATHRAADALIAAYLHLPEEKRAWSPDEKARSPIDQIAECGLMNGYTAELLIDRDASIVDFQKFFAAKMELIKDSDAAQALLLESTKRVIASIAVVPDQDLGILIPMPWGNQSLSEIVAYPYWNMSYHLGQINYIASILGCLE